MFKIQVHSLLSISISQSMHSSKIIGIQFYHLKLMCIPQEQYMKMNLLVKSTVFRQTVQNINRHLGIILII